MIAILDKARAGLVPVKRRVSTGAVITFWVRPEKVRETDKMVEEEIIDEQGLKYKKDNPRFEQLLMDNITESMSLCQQVGIKVKTYTQDFIENNIQK